MNTMFRCFRNPLAVLVTVLLLTAVSSSLAQSLPRDVRLQLIAATVQVNAWDDVAGELVPFSGSGTIISPDGYILTNYHVIGFEDTRQHYEWHAIFVTDVNAADLPPRLAYWARFVAGDPLLDLAILRVEELGDESPVPPGTVFPAVPVGDSHALLPGDTLTVVGYPGISGSTITFTQGLMSGWLGEDLSSGGRQWIKTDAKIAGGSSGGAAVNDSGELIGIPTAGIHVLEGQMYEEQLYIRPVSLAWALIGPHVPNVVRAESDPVAFTAPSVVPHVQPVGPVPAVTPPATGTAAVAVPSGHQGSLAIGQSISKTAAAMQPDAITWHSYAVSIPAGQPQITISVTSDDDIDFAYKFGSEILDWSDVDFLENTFEPGGSSTVDNPPAGLLYIDVLNAYPRPISYTVRVSQVRDAP